MKCFHNYQVNDIKNCHGDDHQCTLYPFHLNWFTFIINGITYILMK